MLNKDFYRFVESALIYKNISILVETDGTLISEDLTQKIHELVIKLERKIDSVIWIVSLDAFSQTMYDKIFVNGNFTSAVNSISILQKYFPLSVYPQFTRMNENENELEQFYRFWHEENSPSKGKLIIQKYNDCCKALPDRKPADLSPIERNVCWHLKRDMTILANGEIPLCPQFIFSSLGNAFDDGIENVWSKFSKEVELQINKNYGEKCRDCDEYYTFNF